MGVNHPSGKSRGPTLTRYLALMILYLPITAFADALKCPCKVVQVLDGDTVLVLDQYRSSRKLWLAGIDAPELRQVFGSASRQHLEEQVLNKKVDVAFKTRDRYGRIIGHLVEDGRDINRLQISRGMAWYYPNNPQELSKRDHGIYRATEQSARTEKLGLWSMPDPTPPWQYRAAN